jgi:phosphotransferase system HPr (HPr) family protein
MYKKQAMILNKNGLHARPSAAIVQEALKYESEIKITNLTENITVNGKTVLELLLLGACCGTELLIEATGKDEEEAAKNVANKITELSLKEEGD